jgi:hypothetical protein
MLIRQRYIFCASEQNTRPEPDHRISAAFDSGTARTPLFQVLPPMIDRRSKMARDDTPRPEVAVEHSKSILTQGTTGGDPDAVLLALGRRFDSLSAELATLQQRDEALSSAAIRIDGFHGEEVERASLERIEAILTSLDPIERAIMAMPATTIEGLGVKARHAAHVFSNYWTETPEQLDWDARAVRLLIEAACSVAGVRLLPATATG